MNIETDDRDVEYIEDADISTLPDGWAMCGTCHRAWNDTKSTSVTPVPSGRCPFEYEHEDDDEEDPGVQVDTQGWITLNGRRLTQAEAIETAISLTEAVRRSIDRNQINRPSYYDSARILERQESPLGQAVAALRKVF